MDLEVSIAARILVGGGKLPVAQEEILAALGADSPVAVTEDALAEYCRAVSEKSSCKVYVWMDREEYGNANVFNGGSDYEVVNEVCFGFKPSSISWTISSWVLAFLMTS